MGDLEGFWLMDGSRLAYAGGIQKCASSSFQGARSRAGVCVGTGRRGGGRGVGGGEAMNYCYTIIHCILFVRCAVLFSWRGLRVRKYYACFGERHGVLAWNTSFFFVRIFTLFDSRVEEREDNMMEG